MKTEDDYYDLLNTSAFKLEKESRTVCEAVIGSHPRRRRRENYREWRTKNERRLQRRMAEAAKETDGVEGPVIMGLLGWLAAPLFQWAMEKMLDAAQKALWEAIKKHVREILDNLELQLFPKDEQ